MVSYRRGCSKTNSGERGSASLNQSIHFTVRSPLYWLYAAFAIGILLVGGLAVLMPLTASALFGAPVKVADGIDWVRTAGVRDIAIGLMFAAMLVLREGRTAGVLMLLVIIVPVGDAFTVLSTAGVTYQVFLHGVAAIFMAKLGSLLVKRS
jgi:hypothetical protein